MTAGDDPLKLAAACRTCGAVYAAEKIAEEKILPIGRPQGCSCGSLEFDPVENIGESTFEGISD